MPSHQERVRTAKLSKDYQFGDAGKDYQWRGFGATVTYPDGRVKFYISRQNALPQPCPQGQE